RELPQHPRVGRRGGQGGGREREQHGKTPTVAWEPQPAGPGPDQPDQDPGAQDEQAVLGFGGHGDRGHDQEDGGQQPAAAQGAAGESGGPVGDDGDNPRPEPIAQGPESVPARGGGRGPAGG